MAKTKNTPKPTETHTPDPFAMADPKVHDMLVELAGAEAQRKLATQVVHDLVAVLRSPNMEGYCLASWAEVGARPGDHQAGSDAALLASRVVTPANTRCQQRQSPPALSGSGGSVVGWRDSEVTPHPPSDDVHPQRCPAAMAQASTSLVPMGESVPTRCPTTPFDVVCVERPEVRFPAGCDRWACEWCGPRLARRRSHVLAWARPERFVTLTQAPAEWQPLRQKVRKLTMKLRADGYRVEWAWTVEHGGKTGMVHVHLLEHGDFIPQGHLQERWGRIVHVERIKGTKQAANYAMKEATRVAGYALKGSHDAHVEHLERNGGRAYHMSRGYLRGWSTRAVEQLLRPVPPGTHWITVPSTTTAAEGVSLAMAAAGAVEHVLGTILS